MPEDQRTREALQEETRVLEILNKTGIVIASQLDLQTVVQTVTDAGRELSGAAFGAFFYTVFNEKGESLLLYTLSGAPREAFEKFGHPRATPLFGPTFRGEAPVRCADVLIDPRYGAMPPHHGMPKGHLPVRSYLAASVISRSGEVLGGLFFGHPEPNVFTERSERLIVGIASQAAIAIDNARLYAAAQREIAERKRAEEELNRAKAELEERVSQRTASLQETTEQLENFCHTIAHDLRAPLRAQEGFAQMLLDDYRDAPLDVTGQEYALRIKQSAQRLDLLLNNLLSYSSVSREELRFQKVHLSNVLKNVLESLHPEITTQKAAITTGRLLSVIGYEPILNVVFTNLVSNALKFMAPGTLPRIAVFSELREGFVRTWVEDNGIGIDAANTKQIFGVFQRAQTAQTYAGSGVGLAIVQKAVERMAGKVGVESTPGVGSRFWVDLPKGDNELE